MALSVGRGQQVAVLRGPRGAGTHQHPLPPQVTSCKPAAVMCVADKKETQCSRPRGRRGFLPSQAGAGVCELQAGSVTSLSRAGTCTCFHREGRGWHGPC